MTSLTSGSFAATILMWMALFTLSFPAMAIDERPAPGKPETMLGGVSNQTSLNEIIRMYGPPTQEPGTYGANGVITISPGDNDSYIWIKSCVALYVCCLFDDTWDVTTINVFPTHSNCTAENFAKGGSIAQTGFGLRLGDDKAAWNRIYGKQLGGVQPDHGFVLDNFHNGKQLGYAAGGFWRERDKSCDERSSKGEHMPCFRKTRLGAGFDAAGKINFMMMEHFVNTYLPGSEYAPAWLPGDAPPTSPLSSEEPSTPQSDVIAADKVRNKLPTGGDWVGPPAADPGIRSQASRPPIGTATVSPEAGNVVTIEQFQTWTHDNAYAAEQKLQAMGMINIRGRVDRVSANDITLIGDTEIHPKIVCQFRELPRSYGQPFSYATPAEASSLRRDDLVTVAARFRKYLFPSNSTALFEDCRIVQIVPAAQAPRAQTTAPQMGAVSQAPTGASQYSPPAGYYQCYRLTAAISANACKLGDLQLDGQGNYSSTAGPGGTYVFDPAAGVVSFTGGMLNGRMARAKISHKGTYMLRMRPDGNGLPSPNQTFGTYTFEHKRSGHRERW